MALVLLHPNVNVPDDDTYFTVADAARLAGMTPSRLKRWITLGAATPTQRILANREIVATGFTLSDVGFIHLIRHFVDRGDSLEDSILILHHFAARFGPPSERWADAFVAVGGPGRGTLVAFAPDPYLATLPIHGIEGAGQRYFDLLGELVHDRVTLESLLIPREFREFVEINANKEGGHPVVRGTRISTAAIRAIARRFGKLSVTADYFPHITQTVVRSGCAF